MVAERFPTRMKRSGSTACPDEASRRRIALRPAFTDRGSRNPGVRGAVFQTSEGRVANVEFQCCWNHNFSVAGTTRNTKMAHWLEGASGRSTIWSEISKGSCSHHV